MKATILKIFAVMALVLATTAGAQTWDCGETPGTVTATLSGGTLTISGTGAMADYDRYSYYEITAPWRGSIDSITNVVIREGVTSIGNGTFMNCWNLTSVTIPNSVTFIGESAFAYCTGLTSVTIPNSVTSIGVEAFEYCAGLISVTIGNSVTSIGNHAFYGCTGLTSVTIPNSVTFIGDWVFSSCTGLTNIDVGAGNTAYSSVDGVLFNKAQDTLLLYPRGKQGATYSIPNSVTSIGSGAFSDCAGLTSITIPNSVTSIGSSAFSGCTGLTSIAIPNSVISIGGSAFYRCTGLTSVTIPNSVTTIGSSAFSGCTSLTNIEVDAGNTAYSSADGVLFNKNKSILVEYPKGKQGAYIIPNSVTSFGNDAFSDCVGLTSVTIPNVWTSINRNMFSGCTGLTNIEVSTGNTVYSSIDGVVFNKAQDTLMMCPEGRQGAYTIPNSVKSIRESAFSGVKGLASVTISDSVKFIGQYAFSGCTGLKTVISLAAVPPSVYTTAFSDVTGCLLVPQERINAYLSGNLTWRNFNCIRAWEVRTWDCGATPGTVTATLNDAGTLTVSGTGNMANYYSISNVPWYGFRGLITDVVISDGVTSIGNLAFREHTGLTSVMIDDGVTSIGNEAFQSCRGLTSVTIGNSVTSIGDNAFYACSSLTSITIPNSVTTIAKSAFESCSRLTSVTIGDGVTSIGERAFSGCIGLTSVTIGNSVDTIGSYAFSGCTGLASVKSLTIPNSVTTIGYGAFSSYTGLTSMTIGDGLTNISILNFYLDSLTTINVNSGNPKYSSIDGVLFSKERDTLLLYPRGRQGAYTIPDGVTAIVSGYGNSGAFSGCTGLTSITIGNSVITIGYGAFSGCVSLTSIAIPNNVTSIASGAFSGCTGLTNIDVGTGNTVYSSVDGVLFSKERDNLWIYPVGKQGASYTIPNSVTSIGDYAFSSCTGLTSVTIPNSVTRIEGGAFSGCTGLTSITIPNGVTEIQGDVFSGCTGLTSITIPNGVTEIGGGAFSGCTGLTSVTIPNSVISFGWNWANYGDGAFSGCTGLTSVVIPNSVTYIGYKTFEGCTGLKSITIPNSVASIGQYAFSNCTDLTSVSSLRTVPPDIDNTVFEEVPVSSACLYVPQAVTNAYRSAEVWKDFSCVQAISGLLNVRFDSRGGSAVGQQYALRGYRVLVPADPVKSDSLFGGWHKNAARTAPWDFYKDTVASDVTLYAMYISKEYVPAVHTPKINIPILPEAAPDSAVPDAMLKEVAVAPASPLAGEFTAGPNPVSRQSGIINFYRRGKQVTGGELSIYDITGNIISKVTISDMAIDNQLKRKVGSWDIRDKNGRMVSVGTYLVRGTVKTSDGKTEKVSLIIGIR